MRRAQCVVAGAQPLRHTGPEALYEHVGGLDQATHGASALLGLQVQCDETLSAGERRHGWTGAAAADDDHFGTEVRQQHRAVRTRRVARHVDHAHTRERESALRRWLSEQALRRDILGLIGAHASSLPASSPAARRKKP